MSYHYGLMADFRHAICNEAFKDYDFREACRSIRSIGYTGIEIAPFTLADDPLDISAGRRAEYRRLITDEGLTFVGLHWLMVSPKPLHVTTSDEALRKKSWEYLSNLVDLCADGLRISETARDHAGRQPRRSDEALDRRIGCPGAAC